MCGPVTWNANTWKADDEQGVSQIDHVVLVHTSHTIIFFTL